MVIRRSEILSSKGQGHEVKSGGYVTLIEDSVIASMDGVDSRLIDVTQGGRLTIRRSVLEEGRASANSDMIGYALEGFRFPKSFDIGRAVYVRSNRVFLIWPSSDPRGKAVLTARFVPAVCVGPPG